MSQPFRYTGREWDAVSEFYHYRARKYDPEMGRFIQRDPFGFDGQDFNIFRYAQGNPLRYSDPYGFSATETAGLNSNNGKKGASAKNLGDRINCLFGGLGAVLAVAQGGSFTEITPNLSDCSAKGYKVSKKKFTSCKVVTGGGASPGAKGKEAVNFILEVLQEVSTIESITEATFKDKDGVRSRVDIVASENVTKQRIGIEVKNGQFANPSKNQKIILPNIANCKGVGKGKGLDVGSAIMISFGKK